MVTVSEMKLPSAKSIRQSGSRRGTVLIITVLAVALLAAMVMGILQINAVEIQSVKTQVSAARALATAEAGLNDAMYELRMDSGWNSGFVDKAFAGGSYTVTVSGSPPSLVITSVGTGSDSGFARVEADVTIGTSSPHIIRIDHFRVNQ